MNVLFLIAERNYGATSLLVGQALALHNEPLLNMIFVSGDTEKEAGLFDKLNKANVQYIKIRGLEFNIDFFRIAHELRDIILKQKIKIVHVQTNWQLALISYVKLIIGKKLNVLYTIHGYRHNSSYLKSLMARCIISAALFISASKVIVTSSYVKNKFFFISYKIELMYLGVDDAFFSKSDNFDLRTNEIIKIFFAGDFRAGKNQDLLIRMFAKYITKYPQRKLFLVLPGLGPLKKNCESLAKNLGISEFVEFPGFISKENVVRFVNSCKVAVIPTNSETFGLCIAEPFSAGRCVISRDVGVASDIIVNSLNGFLFTHDYELFSILENVLNDINIIYRCGDNAFRSRKMLCWSSITPIYSDIISSL